MKHNPEDPSFTQQKRTEKKVMDISQVYVSIRTSILFLFTCEGTLSVLTITISLTEKNILTPQATNFNCLSGRLKHQ